MPDQLDDRLRAELRGGDVPPAWFYERVATGIRETPQVRRPLVGGLPARFLPAMAAVLVVAVLVTGGPFLYGTLMGPGPSESPAAPTPGPTIAGTAPTASATPSAAPTPTPTPIPTPSGVPLAGFNLEGTSWRLLQLPGVTLAPETTPTIEFRVGDASEGFLFPGCGAAGFSGTFSGGDIVGLHVTQTGLLCPPEVRDTFMRLFAAASAWAAWGPTSADPDRLVLTGPAGVLQFERQVPAAGVSRQVLDALRTGWWKVAAAPGLKQPASLQSMRFGDRRLQTDPGNCGFGGTFAFGGTDGQLALEIAFDATVCSSADERAAFAIVANSATSARLDASGAVRLATRTGDVVLVRDSTHPTATASPAASAVQPGEVTFMTAQTGVMAGYVPVSTTPGLPVLYRTTDGGKTWIQAYRGSGVVEGLTSAAGTSHVWAVLSCGTSMDCAELLHSADAGATWQSMSVPGLVEVAFRDARNGWGLFFTPGDPGRRLRATADGGASWTDLPSPCSDFPSWRLVSVAVTPGGSMAACSGDTTGLQQVKAVTWSGDGGLTWTVRASTGDPDRSSIVTAGTISTEGTIERLGFTADGAAWWTGSLTLPQRSSDGGATWASDNLGYRTVRIVRSVWLLDGLRGWGLLWDPDLKATLLMTTTDAGKDWIEVTRWPAAQ